MCGHPPPGQYESANRQRRQQEERDKRWLAQLARPTRIAYRQVLTCFQHKKAFLMVEQVR
jgi:hypothetical protein